MRAFGRSIDKLLIVIISAFSSFELSQPDNLRPRQCSDGLRNSFSDPRS